MKRLQVLGSLIVIGLSLCVSQWHPSSALAQEAESGRKMLYLFSADFPPNPLVQYPSPPRAETRFWQLLDKEMTATPDLTLTDNPEEADYRIDLRCGGVFNCSRLIVDIKNPNREVLASFTLKHIARFGGVGAPKLEMVAHELTTRLDERLKLLEQGGYGHSD